MEKNITTWGFVPKPRSIIKTVEWFPSLVTIEGDFWNEKNEKGEHPVRREYLKLAHPYDEYKETDPEINARMEFARYQTLGLAYLDNTKDEGKKRIVITKAGKELIASENKEEIILRQLLKLQFPSNIHSSSKYSGMRIFPLEIIMRVLNEFGSVNRLEVAFSVFTCTNIKEIDSVFSKIREFRKLVAGKLANDHKKIFLYNFEKYNGNTGNQPETYLGNYDDVLFRHLEYTSIFESSGRGEFTKLYVPERSKIKFKQLFEQYRFDFFEKYEDTIKFYDYFGDPYAVALPWESKESLLEIVNDKLDMLIVKKQKHKTKESLENLNIDDLKTLEVQLNTEILEINEKEFVEKLSKTKEERDKIIEKFTDIDSGDEDLSALWLEVNTWKSLVAMRGTHYVKRNFKIGLDLTPRSFASGTNNTPDMELYNQKYIIIPEVSIQSGVQQWITEGSSIIEHVLKFLGIKNGKKFPGVEDVQEHINPENIQSVYGFFLCRKINERLLWQMYILNKEAWIGEPVAVVPMEIKTYIRIIKFLYDRDIPALRFEELIAKLARSARNSEDFRKWQDIQTSIVNTFLTTR